MHLQLAEHLPVELYRLPRPDVEASLSRSSSHALAESILRRGMDGAEYLKSTVATELEVIADFEPNVIVTENHYPIGISAELRDIPVVATAATFNTELFVGGTAITASEAARNRAQVLRRYNEARYEHGLEPLDRVQDILNGRAAANIVPSADFLEPLVRRSLPAVSYVGPLLYKRFEYGDFPISVSDLRTAYVYLSADDVALDGVLRQLEGAGRDLGWRFIVVKRSAASIEERCDYVIVAPHVPGSSVLAHCEVSILRGGQNGLVASLLAGVPVIGIPGMSAEPRWNLAVLETHGCALTVKDITDGLGSLKECLGRIASNGQFGICAQHVGEELRRLGGVQGALDVIDRVADRRSEA